MKNLILVAGVAALAIAAPATAEKGGKGGGNGGAKVERGGGGGQKMERGGGGDRKAFKMERRGGGDRQAFKAERRGGGEGKAFKQAREQRQKFVEQRFERAKKSDEKRFERVKKAREQRWEGEKRFAEQRSKGREKMLKERSKGFEKMAERQRKAQERAFEGRRDRDWNDNVRLARMNDWDDFDRWDNTRSRSYGCPPGLAKKGNGCMPPGQAKKLIGNVLPAAFASSYLPDSLRSYYQDDDDHYYRYGDGYVYRVDRSDNLIASLLPLFGGSFGLGQAFPLSNAGYSVPNHYSSFYPDTQNSAYRYDDGYLYQVDPYTGLVEDVSPMLGYGYGVGQVLPAGYSAYNVPYQYRDMYYDTDDYQYRYAPGAIYQVDRDTSLITSVASLLTGQPLGIGQQLPMGYDAYNVPYSYRDEYYDTDDNMYRYADGNIYQVDPTTRLITAVIDAIV